MTDKQIIIDGVDVSGCEYYNKEDKTCREVNGNYDTDICEFDKCENSNCHYKNWKCKEQEYEELKETIDDFIADNNSLYCDDGKQPSNLDELQECMQSSMNEFVKYKQTLDEIVYQVTELFLGVENKGRTYCEKILDIINKAKENIND